MNCVIVRLSVGSRGIAGELRIKELEKVKLPWVSNPKIQEKLFNLLDNDLAKLIKEKLLRVNIQNKENGKN